MGNCGVSGGPVDCARIHKHCPSSASEAGRTPLDRRDLYNGFGDTLARAVEFAGVPVIFALVGAALDRRFGTVPVLTVALLVVALAGTFVRTWCGYVEAMKAEEAKGPWHRH